MYSRLAIFPLLFMTAAFQAPADSIQRHYKAAQTFHNTGRLSEAEASYKTALGEAYAYLGKIFLAGGEHQKAVKSLDLAVANGTVSEAILIDQATAYFHIRQYEKAAAPLKKILASNPGSAAARHLLGKAHFMLREFDKAADELSVALKLAPADFDAAYTLALAHLKQNRLAPARQIFDRMIEKLGNRAEVHNLFGRAYRETKHFDEAIEEFKKTIALDSKHRRAHYNLGLSYLLKDGPLKLKEAAAELRIELATYPDEFLAVYNLGLVLVVERKHAEAVDLLEKAAHLRPQNPDVRLFLGNAYHGMGRYEKAIESLKASFALNPNMDKISPHAAEAHFLFGQSLVRAGRAEEGEQELEIARKLKAKELATDREKIVAYLNTEEFRGAQLDSETEEKILSATGRPDAQAKEKFKESEIVYTAVVAKIHNQMGLLYGEHQNFHAAIEQFRYAVDWDGNLQGAHYNLGLACYKAELYKEAIPALEAALKTAPANLSAKHLLGMCYFMAEDHARASTILREVLTVKPNDIGLYYMLALSLLKEGKVNEGSDCIAKMLARYGDSPQIHLLLGQAHHAQNQDERALEELKKAFLMDSRLPLAHYYSGMIYIQMGRFDEAAREFEAELFVNPKDANAKYHLAFVLLASGQTERGMKLMREVISSKPDFADARYELGKAMLQQGDVKGAIESLEAALKAAPDKPHIHYQLGRAYTAAGRLGEAQRCFDTFKRLKDKERNRTDQPTDK
ncbi:MAG: tetratricopeptide repeat protein [Blastocatellia bacterium]|nr:tetratricopeptide repeat protein [Blastocatellia bacterium]